MLEYIVHEIIENYTVRSARGSHCFCGGSVLSTSEVFFTEQLHAQVAAYVVEHGGQVEAEAVGPYVFQKVTLHITSSIRFGCGDNSPIYTYALADGGQLLIQFHRSKGHVPGHYEAYWVTIYIQTEGR